MGISDKKERVILFVGDIAIFFGALWITLLVRYVSIPDERIWIEHVEAFSVLFVIWIIAFYVAGLYDRHTAILKSKLPTLVFRTELVNSAIAIAFFYFIPFFAIAPKTNLFIYLAVSSAFILLWRIYGLSFFSRTDREKALIIGTGDELQELKKEINADSHYGFQFVSSVDTQDVHNIDFKEEVLKNIYSEEVSIVAIDLRNANVEPILPSLYKLIFSKVKFIDMYRIYEEVFGRVPLSLLRHNWFIENISASPKTIYDALKRVMDVIVALVLGLISLLAYPFVWAAIKMEDGGSMFIVQERVGQNNKPIRIYKFRSMTHDDRGAYAEESAQNIVTRTGAFLRKTRIDELPQLWNVLKGDLSLIGPRPELPALVRQYEAEIPYYNIRHLIKPGLSGWAQIHHEAHPHHKVAHEETAEKLSYDLYYIKNRSLAPHP